jgi:hypothetical protein
MKINRIVPVAALALAVFRPAPAQETPPAPGNAASRNAATQEIVTRIHDAGCLLAPIRDHFSASIEYPLNQEFTTCDPQTPPIGMGLLENLVNRCIAEGTWEDKRHEISIGPAGRLLVRHTPDVHDKVDRLIARLQTLHGQTTGVEGTAALVEDALLDEWRGGSPVLYSLSDAAVKSLHEALAGGRRASPVGSFRCTALNRWTGVSDHSTRPYVRTYVHGKAPAAGTAVPDTDDLRLGISIDTLSLSHGDRILCDVHFRRQTGTLPVPAFETGVPGLGPIGLPETSFVAAGTVVAGRSGETLLVARMAAPDPKAAAGASARSLCFFVRPTMPPPRPVPTIDTEGPLQVRLVDIRALADASMPPWTRELDGEDPEFVGDVPAMMEAIRNEIAPASWESPGVTLGDCGGFLVVRQTPAVADQVVQWVERRAPLRFRRIAMRADLLMADRGTFQALLAKHPGLGRASAAVDAEELARLTVGNGVTRLDSADVVGVSGQYMTLKRVDRFACVKGYTAGNPDAPALPDVEVMTDGFALRFKPELSEDGKTVLFRLQFYGSRASPPVSARDEAGRPVRQSSAVEASWAQEYMTAAGTTTLIDGGLNATVDGEPRRLLLLVRFTPVP